jgi:hypothetical protein
MSVIFTFRIHLLISLICIGLTVSLAFYAQQIAQRSGESAYGATFNDSRHAHGQLSAEP